MRRCIQLAKLGAGYTAPNPMVGAILVYNDRIIGEGYHEKFGEAHAEVNCINSVSEADRNLINKSTLYVSLEPCSHFGKTPPCADLILQRNIPHVIIGCSDTFEKVNGGGIQKLTAAGVQVETDVLKEECINLNKRFFVYHKQKRPYIILKWAESNDGFIAGEDGKPRKISNEYTNMLTHKWRSEEAAILVGTNTAITDNPSLTVRNWFGKNPIRIVIDKHLKLSKSAVVFNTVVKTIIFNSQKTEQVNNIFFHKIADEENFVEEILEYLYLSNILSCIVEGGAKTHQSFIDKGFWDEARIITNTLLKIENGIKSPLLINASLTDKLEIVSDRINFFTKQ